MPQIILIDNDIPALPRTNEAAVDADLEEAIDRQADPVLSINTVGLLQNLQGQPDTLRLTAARLPPLQLAREIATFAWVDAFFGKLSGIETALNCICEAIESLDISRLEVVTTVVSRPVNISVQDGSPGPEIFAGGWVLFHDAAGNVGQRSYIFTNNQRHVSDLPNATGYTYHLMPGFDVTFT